MLNTPDELYSELGGERFWELYNQPWLDNAIARNDVIVLATTPNLENCAYYDKKPGRMVLYGFGKAYRYLVDHGYQYDSISCQMVRK